MHHVLFTFVSLPWCQHDAWQWICVELNCAQNEYLGAWSSVSAEGQAGFLPLKEQRVLSCKPFTILFKRFPFGKKKRFPFEAAFCFCSMSGTLLIPLETVFGAERLLYGLEGTGSCKGGADWGPSLEACASWGSSWGAGLYLVTQPVRHP